jgi:hypothetical protein
MTTATTSTPATRALRTRRQDPIKNGLPDPRPVTEYTAVLSNVAGKDRLTITLSQPCVIRSPHWPVIDCTANTLIYPTSTVVLSNTQFYLEFGGLLDTMVAFVQVPYQDTAVQNYQGGFVRPGGQWFREPISAK